MQRYRMYGHEQMHRYIAIWNVGTTIDMDMEVDI